MATGTIAGAALTGAIYENQYYSVWVKQEWTDDWTYVPYLRPIQSEETTGAAESSASFEWDYGEYVNLWGDAGQILTPLTINDWKIGIMTHTIYGTYWSWMGVVVSNELDSEGEDYSTWVATGVQTIKAKGLEYLLMSRRVLGTWVYESAEGAARWVSRTQPYNHRINRRRGLEGNRSTSVDPSTGVYMHSKDGNGWSNIQIIENVLALYQNIYALYNPFEIQFVVIGQWEALQYVYEEHDLHGKTIYDALNELIDRKRGLGWGIITDGVGPVYINIFSLSATTIYPGDIAGNEIPAAGVQVDLTFDRDPWVHPNVEITSINQYDEIVVESTEPVKVTASFSGSAASTISIATTGKLASGWTSTKEAAYLAATDGERQAAEFNNVFSYMRVDDDMDLSHITPWIDGNGYVHAPGEIIDGTPTYGHFWRFDKKFLRYLPFSEEGTDSDEVEQRQAFALVQIDPPETGDPDPYYVYVGKTQLFEKKETGIHLADNDLALWFKSAANHVFADGTWTSTAESSDIEPEFDLSKAIITAQFETDQAIGCTLYPNGYVSPNKKQLYIPLKGVEVWYIPNLTVKDVSGGTLTFQSGDHVFRDDTSRLRAIAVMAWIWYGQQRATIDLTIKNNLNWFGIGNLIRTAVIGLNYEQIGTSVTSIRRDYKGGTQHITTGYGELDPKIFTEALL